MDVSGVVEVGRRALEMRMSSSMDGREDVLCEKKVMCRVVDALIAVRWHVLRRRPKVGVDRCRLKSPPIMKELRS